MRQMRAWEKSQHEKANAQGYRDSRGEKFEVDQSSDNLLKLTYVVSYEFRCPAAPTLPPRETARLVEPMLKVTVTRRQVQGDDQEQAEEIQQAEKEGREPDRADWWMPVGSKRPVVYLPEDPGVCEL